MQTSREVILNTLTFNTPDRFGFDFPEPYGSDFWFMGMSPSPDNRPPSGNGTDEWGAVWENIGASDIGEVKEFPLKSWDDFPRLRVPDIRDPRRFEGIRGARQRVGDKFLLGWGISLYARAHYIRGLENTWCDIYTDPDKLGELLDILVGMNLYVIEQYAKEGFDGYIFCDDWGLQDRLMISPEAWRTLWKPRYAKIFAKAQESGIRTFMHSCGHIVDILDDLIDIGLDVVHMDQQANMGLDLLGKRFGGRLTFFSPVDIQTVLPKGDYAEIRAYARHMARAFATRKGGFIPRWYTDPQGAGHSMDAVNVMCEEFLKISKEMYGH